MTRTLSWSSTSTMVAGSAPASVTFRPSKDSDARTHEQERLVPIAIRNRQQDRFGFLEARQVLIAAALAIGVVNVAVADDLGRSTKQQRRASQAF